MSTRIRTEGMKNSLRCGAKTRKGLPCQSPATFGKMRCRMHGGALGSGAPKGNKNALKNGYYTAEAKAERKNMRALLKEMEEALKHLN